MIPTIAFALCGVVAYAQKSVLFIAVDDLRPQLGVYDQATLTPNLDALASRGVAFSRAYCQVSICSPSRTSFLTGMRPDATRLWTMCVWQCAGDAAHAHRPRACGRCTATLANPTASPPRPPLRPAAIMVVAYTAIWGPPPGRCSCPNWIKFIAT